MRPVVLFAPPRGVAALAAFFIPVSLTPLISSSCAGRNPIHRNPAADRCHLHPHRHPQQQWQQRQSEGPVTAAQRQRWRRHQQRRSRRRRHCRRFHHHHHCRRYRARSGNPRCRTSFRASRHPDDQVCLAASTAPARRWTCAASASPRRRTCWCWSTDAASTISISPEFDFSSDSPQQHRPHRDHPRQQRRRALRRRSGRRRHQHRDQDRRRAAPNARFEGAFGSFQHPRGQMSRPAAPKWALGGRVRQRVQFRRLSRQQLDRQIKASATSATQPTKAASSSTSRATICVSGLPGPRNILNGPFVGFINEYVTDRRGTDTPLDYSNRQNMAMRGGVTRKLWNGAELTVDGSFRQKQTQSRLLRTLQYAFCGAERSGRIRRDRIDDAVDYAAAEYRPDLRCVPLAE